MHVTMALASLPGKLDDVRGAMAKGGLNTIELDVKDENGEVGFVPARVAARATAIGAAKPYYNPRAVGAEDPRGRPVPDRPRSSPSRIRSSPRSAPSLRSTTRTARVWHTSGGLGWVNEYDRRVWTYNVAIATGRRARRLRRDPVRLRPLPVGRRRRVDPLPRAAQTEPKAWTIARFVRYARVAAASARRARRRSTSSVSLRRAISASGRSRGALAQYVDTVYPMVYPSHFNPGEYGLADPNADPGMTVTDALLDFDTGAARVARRGSSRGCRTSRSARRTPTPTCRRRSTRPGLEHAQGFMLWNPLGLYTGKALSTSRN